MTWEGLARARLIRRLSLLLALLAALALLYLRGPILYTDGYGAPGSFDFLEYWGAAQLLLRGGNPYDPIALLAVQQVLGWLEPKPVLMWNPPWTLAVVLPLGLLPFGLATQVWLLLQLGLILGSGLLLWRYFAPGDARYWLGPLLAAAFVPALFALRNLTAAADPPLYWATPTLGAWLRAFLGQELRWLQFLPALLGAVLLALWLRRQQSAWDWRAVTPLLLFASALTTAYGWSYDQVVLLPAVVALVARLGLCSPASRAVGLGAWGMSQLGLVIQNHYRLSDFFNIWHPFVLAGLYWWGVGRDPAEGAGDAPGGAR